MKAICERCEIEFNVKPSVLKNGKGRFCSNSCRGAANRRIVKVNCKKCGREFGVLPSEKRKNCSKICAGSARISRAELVADLRRVAVEIGHRPSIREYKRHGKYSEHIIRNYGGLRLIWESLGMVFTDRDPVRSKTISLDVLVKDLRRVRAELGRLPSYSDYVRLGRYTRKAFYTKLKVHLWREVLIKVFDLSPLEIALITPVSQRTYDMWIEMVRDLAIKLKRPPTQREAHNHIGLHQQKSPSLKGRSFKSILDDAAVDSSRSFASPLTPDTEFISDIANVVRVTGRLITHKTYIKYGKFSLSTLKRRLGWDAAKELSAQYLRTEPKTVKSLSHVPDESRDRLKESSVQAIKDFFQPAQ